MVGSEHPLEMQGEGATDDQQHEVDAEDQQGRRHEADPARPQWLLTEAGVGYRLREPTA